jgi:REP element-mobilizing transposase RayT
LQSPIKTHQNKIIMHEEYRFILPHLQFTGCAFFQTWRLKDSIPITILDVLKREREDEIYAIKRKKMPKSEEKSALGHSESRYFQKVDDYLDKIKTGPHWLRQPAIAEAVIARMREFDGTIYRLEAFCIMSNHVHALFDFGIQMPEDGSDPEISAYIQLEKAMQLIKGGSARTCNLLLSRNGSFWERPNFDRYIRNEKHYNNVINYIANNPVKAGLCEHWEDYPYTWIRSVE